MIIETSLNETNIKSNNTIINLLIMKPFHMEFQA
jgi:hypothetical protein